MKGKQTNFLSIHGHPESEKIFVTFNCEPENKSLNASVQIAVYQVRTFLQRTPFPTYFVDHRLDRFFDWFDNLFVILVGRYD